MRLDYTFDRQITLEREEARTEGLEEGRREGLQEGRQKALAEGLEALISTCKELGVSFDDTAARVREKFSLEDGAVQENMRLYW